MITWLHPSDRHPRAPNTGGEPDRGLVPAIPENIPGLGASSSAPDSPESRGVFGRGREIAELAQRLQEKPILLVHGIEGIGKSALIREACRRLPGLRYVPIMVATHTDADALFRQLASGLDLHEETSLPPRAPPRRIDAKILAQHVRESRVVHVHHGHELLESGRFRDRAVGKLLLDASAQLPGCRFVLESARKFPETLLPSRFCAMKRVRGLEAAAVRTYFRQPFGEGDPRGWALKPEEAQALYLRLGGKERGTGAHPLGMMLLASVADGLGETPLAVAFPAVARPRPEESYWRFQEHLFDDLYGKLLTPAQQHLLRLAALYRAPIPAGHVEALQRRVGDGDALRALSKRLLLSRDAGQEHYIPHGPFAKLAAKRVAEDFDLQVDHRVIADAWLERDDPKGLPHILAANEAAHHLLEAEEFHRLGDLPATLLGRDTRSQLERWSVRLHERRDYRSNRYVLGLLTMLDPNNHRAHRFLGEAIERLKGRGAEAALEHYLRARDLYPSFPPYLANVGRNLINRREYERFVKLVDELAPRDRQKAVDAYIHGLYGKCKERMGKGKAASLYRRGLIREDRATVSLYNDEAVYLRKRQRYTEALAILDEANERGIMDDHSWAIRADILQESGSGAASSRLRRERIAAGSRNAAFYNDEALYRWDQLEDPAGALAILEQAKEIGCANDHILSVEAGLLEALDRGEEASRLRRKRIAQGTPNTVFYNDEAVWLREQGKYDEALVVLDDAERNCRPDKYIRAIRRSIERKIAQERRGS
uniref:Novel STAND NTPase 6 domain-containing protein n=1 Tax=Candidatus Kentrum sp. TC TaxID=2126339 RepID=A0A450Y8Q0_9GAMM|nr:MAG: hypothetical protein BECKTC1821E_GA0114239_1001147 [Candidatus Kentron sp. TC]